MNITALLLHTACFWLAADAKIAPPGPNSADEPLAREFSAARAAEFLDGVAVKWTRERKCGTCHTNYAFLLARPAVKSGSSEPMAEVRRFFEERAANWETRKPLWDTEVIATGVALAINDAKTTGKLHPMTRKALDWAWKLQREDGSFDWLKCGWPPMENDDYFGAVYAAIGVASAPEKYAETDAARAGMDRLRGYFKANPAPDAHHRAMLLWASTRIADLLTAEEKDRTIGELQSLQLADGGWSLACLGSWKRHDGSPNDPKGPSDGYGTGFVVHVLRAAGVPASDPGIRRAIDWLKAHQRASGRWFTRSPSSDTHHYLTHAGTAYALLALETCSEAQPPEATPSKQ